MNKELYILLLLILSVAIYLGISLCRPTEETLPSANPVANLSEAAAFAQTDATPRQGGAFRLLDLMVVLHRQHRNSGRTAFRLPVGFLPSGISRC